MSSANFHWYTAWAITFYLAWFWFNFLFCFFCSHIAINVKNFKFLNFWVAWKTSRYHVNYPWIHAIHAESSPIHFVGFWFLSCMAEKVPFGVGTNRCIDQKSGRWHKCSHIWLPNSTKSGAFKYYFEFCILFKQLTNKKDHRLIKKTQPVLLPSLNNSHETSAKSNVQKNTRNFTWLFIKICNAGNNDFNKLKRLSGYRKAHDAIVAFFVKKELVKTDLCWGMN